MKSFIVLFLFLLTFGVNCFALTETDRQESSVPNTYGSNSGFENGIKDITVSSATKSWEGTTKHLGNKALKCTFDATNDYCETKLVAHKGETSNMEWGAYYYVTVATVKAEVIDNSGNIVKVINPLPLNTDYQEMILDYVGVKGASYKLRLTATSGAATPYLDTMHVSKNMGVGSQAPLDKQYDLTTACGGSTCLSGSPSIASVVTAKAIPYKDRNGVPRLRFNIVWTVASGTRTSSTSTILGVVFKNNTDYTPCAGWADIGTNVPYCIVTYNTGNIVVGHTSYVSSRYGASGDVELNSFPTWATDAAAETVLRADSTITPWSGYFGSQSNCNPPLIQGSSFSNLTDTDCSTLTTTSGSGATAIGSGSIGFYKYLKAGKYYVSHGFQMYQTFTGAAGYLYEDVQLAFCPGTSACSASQNVAVLSDYTIQTSGVLSTFYPVFQSATITIPSEGYWAFNTQLRRANYNLLDTTHYIPGENNNRINFTIIPASENFSAPQIVNSVQTSYQGVTMQESVMFGGADTATVCSADPCTIHNQSGGIDHVERAAQGAYFVHFKSGTFSQTPVCTITGGYQAGRMCLIDTNIANTTKDKARIRCTADSGTPNYDNLVTVICHGIK